MLFNLISVAIAASLFTSCSKDEPVVVDGSLYVDATGVVFLAQNAVPQAVNVTAVNLEWYVESGDASATWLHLEKTENSVIVSVDDNITLAQRTAKFRIKSDVVGTPIREVTVTQMRGGISMGVTVKVDMTFGKAGGTQFVGVGAMDGVEWDAEIRDGGGWITIEKSDEGISVTVRANNAVDGREAELAITADGFEDAIVAIKQDGFPSFTEDFTATAGTYVENGFAQGYSRYVITLASTPVDENGYIKGAGMVLMMDIVGEPSNFVYPELPSGTYEFTKSSESPQHFTAITNSEYTYIRYYDIENGNAAIVKALQVVSGSLTVARDGDDYVIDVDLLMNDDTVFKSSYSGSIEMENPAIVSSLRDDVDMGTFSEGGTLIFYGNDTDPGAYRWVSQLWGPGVYINSSGEFAGSGFIVMMQLFSDKASTQNPTAGTYVVEYATYKPFRARTGYTYYGERRGSWYTEIENGMIVNVAPVMSGEITFSGSGSEYTVGFNVRDDIDNRIRGTYKGALRYYNQSSSGAPNAAEAGFRPQPMGAPIVAEPTIKARVSE